MHEPEAAVAIVHAQGPRESILLIRRAERESDPWSGHWSFPGGRCAAGDRDLVDTALRELREECGVTLVRDDLEVALPPANARRSAGPVLLVAPYVFRVPEELPAAPDGLEAVEARWVPLDLLRDPAAHRLTSIPGLPARMLFPCVPLPEMPLWGFTYRLITRWLGLVGGGSRAGAMKIAECLKGVPASSAEARLLEPWNEVPPLNMVELQRDGAMVVELGFEEAWIPFDKGGE